MSFKRFSQYCLTQDALDALHEKAEEHGVSVEVLVEVFDRGVDAWDEDTQKTPAQYAFNRVDSFLNGGYASKLDEDLLNEISKGTLERYHDKALTSAHKAYTGYKSAARKMDNAVDRNDWKAADYHNKKFEKHLKTADKRMIGLSRAKKRLNEVEQIDELSTNTLTNYVIKSSAKNKRMKDKEDNDVIHHHETGSKESFSSALKSAKKRQVMRNSVKTANDKIAKSAMPAGVHEEIEQIDELSKGTLARYMIKAGADAHRKEYEAKSRANAVHLMGKQHAEGRGGSDYHKRITPMLDRIEKRQRQTNNRRDGIKLATHKLNGSKPRHDPVNEEQQIDELSTSTLTNYAAKAGADSHKQRSKMNAKSGASMDASSNYHKLKNRQFGIKKAIGKISSKTTVVGVHEEEQLDEISAPKLRQYVKRAVDHSGNLDVLSDHARDHGDHVNADKYAAKSDKRKRFANKAAEKLVPKTVKEEEQINELSHKTLNNYVAKAAPQAASGDKKRKKGVIMALTTSHVQEDVEQIDEISKSTLKSYVRQADLMSAVHSIDGDRAHGAGKDDEAEKHWRKADKRAAGAAKAEKKLKESVTEPSNAIDISGEVITERNEIDPAQYVSVRRRDTKGSNVIQKHTQRERAMYNTHRTDDVLHHSFKPGEGDKAGHLTDKKGHRLTNRWADERRRRLATLRGNRNVQESAEYIEARQALHQAHADTGRELANRERNPEIRQIHTHRHQKHEHAARVLEKLKARMKK